MAGLSGRRVGTDHHGWRSWRPPTDITTSYSPVDFHSSNLTTTAENMDRSSISRLLFL